MNDISIFEKEFNKLEKKDKEKVIIIFGCALAVSCLSLAFKLLGSKK